MLRVQFPAMGPRYLLPGAVRAVPVAGLKPGWSDVWCDQFWHPPSSIRDGSRRNLNVGSSRLSNTWLAQSNYPLEGHAYTHVPLCAEWSLGLGPTHINSRNFTRYTKQTEVSTHTVMLIPLQPLTRTFMCWSLHIQLWDIKRTLLAKCTEIKWHMWMNSSYAGSYSLCRMGIGDTLVGPILSAYQSHPPLQRLMSMQHVDIHLYRDLHAWSLMSKVTIRMLHVWAVHALFVWSCMKLYQNVQHPSAL